MVRESTIISSREKEMMEQVQLRDQKINGVSSWLELEKQAKLDARNYKQVLQEMETLKTRYGKAEMKLATYQKQELEMIQNANLHATEIEEANFQRDSALQKVATLQNDLETLSKKLQEQPKIFQEKNEIAIQS